MKRIVSVVLVLVLLVSNIPFAVLAAETDNLCEHHTAHTAECGYAPAVAAAECKHEHTDACKQVTWECKHEHSDACYPPATEGEDASQEPSACTHACNTKEGCIPTETIACVHTEHDDTCGYVEGSEEKPCNYDCQDCKNVVPTCNCEEKCTESGNVNCDVCKIEGADLAAVCTGAVKPALCAHENVAADCQICVVETLIEELPSAEYVATLSISEQNVVYNNLLEVTEAYERLIEEQQAQVENLDSLIALHTYFTQGVSETATVRTATTIEEVLSILDDLKGKYDDKYWNFYDRSKWNNRRSEVEANLKASVTSGRIYAPNPSDADLGVTTIPCDGPEYDLGCKSNYFEGEWQCAAFVGFIQYALFQSTRLSSPSEWYTYSGSGVDSEFSLQPGDVIRLNGHSCVVGDVSNGNLTCIEAWGREFCKINWSNGFNDDDYTTTSSLISAIRNNGGTVYRYKGLSQSEGHNYTKTIKSPTCTEQGYTLYECSHCGDSYKEDVVPATGHNFENGVCGNCGTTEVTTVPSGYTAIYTASDLDAVRNNLSGNYILMNDIDLSGWGNWEPIGEGYDPSVCFSGIFDGNGHAIKNINITDESIYEYAGLFAGLYRATVKNIRFVSGAIDCDHSSVLKAGGIAGISYGATISRCANYVSISYKNGEPPPAGQGYQGAMGVRFDGGGIVGNVIEKEDCGATTISECANYAVISGIGADAPMDIGGIIGNIHSAEARVENCYNAASLSANTGFVSSEVGGIVGNAWKVTISHCYNVGAPFSCDVGSTETFSGTSNIGGVLGGGPATAGYVTVNNCYYLNTAELAVSGYAGGENSKAVVNARSCSSSEMQAQSTYSGLNFSSVWRMGTSGYNYPELRWQAPGSGNIEVPLQAPVLTLISNSTVLKGDTIEIHWTEVANAESYKIQATNSNGTVTWIDNVSYGDTPYRIVGIADGTHQIQVTAIAGDQTAASNIVSVEVRESSAEEPTPLPAPVISLSKTSATANLTGSSGTTRISWGAVEGAAEYFISWTSSDGNTKTDTTKTNVLYYALYNLPEDTYTISVSAISSDGTIGEKSNQVKLSVQASTENPAEKFVSYALSFSGKQYSKVKETLKKMSTGGWCNFFVAQCAIACGVEDVIVSGGVPEMYNSTLAKGGTLVNGYAYSNGIVDTSNLVASGDAQVGDLVFNWKYNHWSHIAIVGRVNDDGSIDVINGNWHGGNYNPNDSSKNSGLMGKHHEKGYTSLNPDVSWMYSCVCSYQGCAKNNPEYGMSCSGSNLERAANGSYIGGGFELPVIVRPNWARFGTAKAVRQDVIARCPIEIEISLNGETLSSKAGCYSTSFGTLEKEGDGYIAHLSYDPAYAINVNKIQI